MRANPSLRRKRMDRSDLIWLAYLIFFFIDPVLRGSLGFWLESIGIVAVFLVMYVAFLRLNRFRMRALMLVGMVLLGLACYPFNSGAIAFFIYAAALLPFLVPSATTVLVCFAIESAALGVEGWFLRGGPFHRSLYNTEFGIFFVVVVGGSNIFFAQKQRADARLRMAQEENIALAAVAERERIARDLHDVLGHTLSVIVLKAELAGKLLARGDDIARAAAEIADVERTARSALTEVRETIGGYRTHGLAAEMDAARKALEAAGVVLNIEGAPAPDRLSPAEETVLALALREAVTNIVRHAQAQTCRLRFNFEEGHHSLMIEDDGQHCVQREGNGLRGMRERVESLGGRLSMECECGTRLSIEVPAAADARSTP